MRPALFLRSFLVASLLAGALGCSGADAAPDDSSDEDSAALSAQEVNRQRYGLADHVLADVRASDENAKAGVKRWDVFAGENEAGFRGSVFFASDEGNDVRYVFVANVATRELTFLSLEKDGSKSERPVIDQDVYARLLRDVERLKALVAESARANARANPTDSCGAKIALAGLTLVVGAGVGAALGTAVYLGAAAVSGVILIPVYLLGTVGVAIATVGPIASAATAVSGYVYVTYKVAGSFVSETFSEASACMK